MHMLDGLEVQAPALAGMQAHHFWRQGDSVLDVGAGSGEMTLYLQAKYGLLCRGVDIVKPNNNVFFAKKASNGRGREFLPIDLFDGVSLPCADKSYDLVMINSVLHHAANKTHGLVREAARVARKYIVVLEDLNVLGHRHRRRPIGRGQSRPRDLPLGVRHVWPGTDSRVAQSRSAGHELLLLSWAAASQRRAPSPAIQVRTAPHILPAHLAPHTWLGRGLP